MFEHNFSEQTATHLVMHACPRFQVALLSPVISRAHPPPKLFLIYRLTLGSRGWF